MKIETLIAQLQELQKIAPGAEVVSYSDAQQVFTDIETPKKASLARNQYDELIDQFDSDEENPDTEICIIINQFS